MGLVLLYNISGKKLSAVRLCLMKNGVSSRLVKSGEYSLPLNCLLSGETKEEDGTESAFGDEMMVFCGVEDARFSRILNELRQKRLPVALKAVLTPTNREWTSIALHDEIRKEHLAMTGGAPSVHAGKQEEE